MVMYRKLGNVPPKRHTRFTSPEGDLYHEEMQGEEGFTWNQSFLYHQGRPTTIIAAETVEVTTEPLRPNAPLLPRHLRTHELPEGGNTVENRHLLAGNADLEVSYVVADSTGPLYRNSVGDELVYVESGDATLESPFGSLTVGGGDYVVVPTSTTHRWVPTSDILRLLIVEASGGGHVRPPEQFLSPMGQLLDGSPFNERDLRGPGALITPPDSPVHVIVKNRDGLTRYTYAHHPFDVVGWDGYNYPYALNIHDYIPRVGGLHLPPPTHITFTGPGFVICSFVPRPFDFSDGAVKVPYNHANVDSDEILFYCGGDFMSRAGTGIGVGSISLHPAGFIHGPQPGSVEASLDALRTEETAVMIDTFKPLHISDLTRTIEDPGYAYSWARGEGLVVPSA